MPHQDDSDRAISSSMRQRWMALKKSITHCKACSLHITRYKPCLFRGYLPCDIMYIGGTPDNTEDALGTAMIGPIREIIDSIITIVDSNLISYTGGALFPTLAELPRHCIINTLQCHTPKSAQPSILQVTKCYNHVRKYVLLAQPTLIVLCGSIPLQYLHPSLSTLNHQGTQPHYGIASICHPASILRETNLIRKKFRIDEAADCIFKAYKDAKSRRDNH